MFLSSLRADIFATCFPKRQKNGHKSQIVVIALTSKSLSSEEHLPHLMHPTQWSQRRCFCVMQSSRHKSVRLSATIFTIVNAVCKQIDCVQ